MRLNRYLCCALAAAVCLGMASPPMAAEVDCDAAYCFTAQDFSQSPDPLAGICMLQRAAEKLRCW